MANRLQISITFASILYLAFFLKHTYCEENLCPQVCSCSQTDVDCSNIPLETTLHLPSWAIIVKLNDNELKDLSEINLLQVEQLKALDLRSNRLDSASFLNNFTYLIELKLDKNIFQEIPRFIGLTNLTYLSLSHNFINNIKWSSLEVLPHLKTLDLSNNVITHLKANSFPSKSSLLYLNLNNNKITEIEKGSLDNLTLLVELKLNRNKIRKIGKELFKNLKHLKLLELSRNRLTEIEGLTFQGLQSLTTLKLKRNSIHTLLDGAFFSLRNMTSLQLYHNNLTNITKGWLYGLGALIELSLTNNHIITIQEDAWEFCKNLYVLDLSNNSLSYIDSGTFKHLNNLKNLDLSNNRISFIAEGSFNSTPSLELLELNNNRISRSIEDTNGPFVGLNHLEELRLSNNNIKSINKRAFLGLNRIERLDLSSNSISMIQEEAFVILQNLKYLWLKTTSLLCDCNLKWFPHWLERFPYSSENIYLICAYPEHLIGQQVQLINISQYTCDGHPVPVIDENPKKHVGLKGDNVTFECKATSTSQSPMNFIWRKNNTDLIFDLNSNSTNSPQVYFKNGVIEQTSILHLINIGDHHAGRYQCIVSNEFGTTYSEKAQLTIFALPSLIKRPSDATVRLGSTARLECAATGLPQPQIAWHKDGGNDFPAARERRMFVMPTDDVFFIMNVKLIDSGIYSCTAKNEAGLVVANATLSVQDAPSFVKAMEDKEITAGDPIVLECMGSGSPKPRLTWLKDGGPVLATDRHFFAAEDQLLIIVNTALSDAGLYECIMSNPLGERKGYSRLSIIPVSVVETDMTGIIIITIVCCAVFTSIIWVAIIYQTRKRMAVVEIPPVNDSCLLSKTHLSSPTISATNTTPAFLDNHSDHSSGNDSGTGDSAKRSNDQLLLEFETIAKVDCCKLPRRTDHDRCCPCRWSAPGPPTLSSIPKHTTTSSLPRLNLEEPTEATPCIG